MKKIGGEAFIVGEKKQARKLLTKIINNGGEDIILDLGAMLEHFTNFK